MSTRNTVIALMSLLTGLILGQLLIPSPGIQPSSSARERATESAAVAFYEAVNRYLELGDSSELAVALDSGFVDHSPIAPNQDAAGLVRYLTAMRATYPNMRILVTGMTPRDDLVAVAVATTGGTAAVSHGPISDRPTTAPGYEQLRIVDGEVAERWASRALPPHVELAASVNLRHLSGWFVESVMEPIVLAPGASETRRQFSHSLLMPSSGSVSLKTEERGATDSPLLLSGESASPTALRRGVWVELENERVVLFPEGESYRIQNTGQQPATVLFVQIRYRPPAVTLHNGETARSVPAIDPNQKSPTGLLPMGTDADLVYSLFLVEVTAAPGEMLPIHSVGGLEQLLVAEGSLQVAVHAGAAGVIGFHDGAVAVPGDRQQLLAGEGLTAHSDALLSYRVTGDDPATIWFVMLIPAPASARSR